MKTTYLKFITLLITVVLAAPLTTHADDAIFRLGVSAPLTGDLLEYGAAVRNGVTLALEGNKESSHVKVIFEDNGYEANKALSALKRLQTQEHIDLLYSWGEQPLHAIAPVAEKAKLPVLAMSVDPIPSLNKKYIIRTINYAAQYSEVMAQYLKTRGYKKIGIVQVEDPFQLSLIEALKAQLGADQSVTQLLSVGLDGKDFHSAIAKGKEMKLDALGVYLNSGQVSNFYRQMKELKWELPTFGTDIFESETEIQNAQGGMEGAVYPNTVPSEEFHRTYKEKFGNDIQIAYAYNAYIVINIVVDLFTNKQKRLDSEEIITALRNVQRPEFKVQSSKEGGTFFEFPIHMKGIKNGHVELLR